jgi:dihydrofolate reductase
MEAIALVDRFGALGSSGSQPFLLKEDMRRFRDKTKGKAVIVGKTTLRDIGVKLPGRTTYLLSSSPTVEDAKLADYVCKDIDALIERLKENDDMSRAMVIGGATIYNQLVSYINRFYLAITLENHVENADVYLWGGAQDGELMNHVMQRNGMLLINTERFLDKKKDSDEEVPVWFTEYRRG